jgi:hypothetical protein
MEDAGTEAEVKGHQVETDRKAAEVDTDKRADTLNPILQRTFTAVKARFLEHIIEHNAIPPTTKGRWGQSCGLLVTELSPFILINTGILCRGRGAQKLLVI